MEDIYKTILTKRFQTTMIGSLAAFELTFGYLWGQDKEEEDLTPEEIRMFDLWDTARNNVLNNGNNQLRKSIVEMDKLQKEQNMRYHYKFYPKREDT